MKTRYFKQGFKMNSDGASGAPATPETPKPETTKSDPQPKQGSDHESLHLKEIEKLKKENQKLIQSQKEKEMKEAEKNGQFEKLYLEMKQQNEAISNKYKQDKIKNAVTLQAKDMGLTKTDFIKLMDLSELDMDDDGNVIGVSDALESFKTRFPELFQVDGSNTKEPEKEKPVPPTDNARKAFTRGIEVDDVEKLNAIINDPKTGSRQREKAIAKRLTLKMNKK